MKKEKLDKNSYFINELNMKESKVEVEDINYQLEKDYTKEEITILKENYQMKNLILKD